MSSHILLQVAPAGLTEVRLYLIMWEAARELSTSLSSSEISGSVVGEGTSQEEVPLQERIEIPLAVSLFFLLPFSYPTQPLLPQSSNLGLLVNPADIPNVDLF